MFITVALFGLLLAHSGHDHEHHDDHVHHHHDNEIHDHHDHSHDHASHGHDAHPEPNRELISESEEITFENLFPKHLLDSKDPNVKFVIWFFRITKAHLFVQAFDRVLKPLPKMMQALSATLFITVVPVFFVYAINRMVFTHKQQLESVTQYLISFAIGGLLGDVFFHTLPHIAESSAHGQSHEGHDHGAGGAHSHDTGNNLLIIIGIISFFLLERLTQELLGGGHSHTHSHGDDKKHNQKENANREKDIRR